MKMAWYKQQLSKLPLKNCLRFLRSESLTSISRLVPEDLREGKVDVKDKHEFFIPATRNVNTGNAGLFKSSVPDDDKQHTALVNVIILSITQSAAGFISITLILMYESAKQPLRMYSTI